MNTKKQLYRIAYRNVRIADNLRNVYESTAEVFGDDSVEARLAYDALHKALHQVSWDIFKKATLSRLMFEEVI